MIRITLLACLLLAFAAMPLTHAAPPPGLSALDSTDLNKAAALLSASIDALEDASPKRMDAVRTIMRANTTDADKAQKLAKEVEKPPSRNLLSAAELEPIRDVAVYAAVVSCPNETTIKSWTCTRCADPRTKGTTDITVINGGATRGIVVARPSAKQIVVSFRGSANDENWRKNLEFNQINYPFPVPTAWKGKVTAHKGFIESYDTLRKATLEAVRGLYSKNPGFSIILTGHSLGASLATMAAVDFVAELNLPAKQIQLITFGSPRVGEDDFPDMVASLSLGAIHRMVNENDVVAHLPPTTFNFFHTIGEKYTYGGKVYVCADQEDSQCSNSRVPFLSAEAHGEFLGEKYFFGSTKCLA